MQKCCFRSGTMATQEWNTDTIVDALANEDKKKQLSATDFVKMHDALAYEEENIKNQPDPSDRLKKINELKANRAQLLSAVNEYVKGLSASDLSQTSFDKLQDYTNCLETFGLKTTNNA